MSGYVLRHDATNSRMLVGKIVFDLYGATIIQAHKGSSMWSTVGTERELMKLERNYIGSYQTEKCDTVSYLYSRTNRI